MAMKPLVEGECGGSNPLMRVAQHLTQTPDILADNRLKNDNLLSDQWAEELLRNTCQSRFQALEDENRFKMDSILQALEKKDIGLGPNFTGSQLRHTNNDLNWAGEFLSCTQVSQADAVQNDVNRFFGKSALPNFNEDSQWAQDYLEKSSSVGVIGGSRILASVKQAESAEKKAQTNRNIWSTDFLENVIDQPLNSSVDMGIPKSNVLSLPSMQPHFLLNGINSSTYDAFANASIDSIETLKKEYDSGEKNGTELLNENKQSDSKANVEEISETVNDGEDDELDYWNHMAEEFKKKMNENPEKYEGFFDSPEYELPGLQSDENFEENQRENESDEYVFSEDLQKADEETPQDAFELGMKHLKEGDLPLAVTCFEVACHRQPEVAKHWQYLGIAQAHNEYDLAAIRALKHCLLIDPENLSALMALAVCFTNERMEAQACDTLKQWMMNNPKYNCLLCVDELSNSNSGLAASTLEKVGRPAANAQFGSVKEMFITAARLYPYEPDADVQCGLGVLFNISGEYEKAIDCFRCALNVRSDDPALWNRLGASLANDGQSASAIAAYRRSLELNPGFTRTRYNIGISCISLGAYKEAVEHFLTVLNLQRLSAANAKTGQKSGLISQNVWNSLRYVLSMMQRRDLYPLLERRDLDFFNREFGIEF